MYWLAGELINKDSVELSIKEPGLLYGATVFTTMRVYDNSLSHPATNWYAHCDRLKSSLTVFGWQQPNWQRIEQGAQSLLTCFPVLRIAIFPDGREFIIGRDLPPDLESRQQQGITAWVATDSLYRRDLSAHKTGNYLGAYLALQKARQLGAKEAILIDKEGNWLETSTGNLWGWDGESWYTPALDVGILPGIARSQLLRQLQSNNISVQENIWTPEFINNLQAIAYSNCVVGIVPVRTIKQEERTDRSFEIAPVKQQLSQFINV